MSQRGQSFFRRAGGRLAASLAFAVAMAVAASAAEDGAGGSFTLAMLPDTQNMIDYRHQKAAGFPFDAAELFQQQMDYLASRSAARGGDLVFVAAVGDVWQHQSEKIDPEHAKRGMRAIDNAYLGPELEATPQTRAVEMPTARRGYATLAAAGVPFGVAPGNHDYDAMWSDGAYPPVADAKPAGLDPAILGMLHIGGLDNFRSVFGAESEFFRGQPWYVASWAGGTSSAQVFEAGGYRFLHLALEMSPSDEVIAWAAGVIAAHPGLPTIVSTHDYLNPAGARAPVPILDMHAADATHNDAEALWRKLIRPHDQIFLVLCGHQNGQAMRVDPNDAGHAVIQILADFQDRGQTSLAAGVPLKRGQPEPIGDGWLRLMTFDTRPAAPTLRVRSYSPHYGKDSDELPEYASWYRPHEAPAKSDAAFLASDSFELALRDFRIRFGAPGAAASAPPAAQSTPR